MWAIFSILSALFWSISDAFAKKGMNKGLSSGIILPFRYMISLFIILPFLSFTTFPNFTTKFWLLHLLWLPLEITALFLYMKAIKIAPLSETLPYLSLTPLFLALTGWVFLKEKVSFQGIIGIMTIVLGSALLNYEGRLRFSKGSLIMIVVALLYSFTSIVGKQLVKLTSPLYFSVHYAFVMGIVLSIIAILKYSDPFKMISHCKKEVFLSSLFFAGMIVFHMLAIEKALVAYMIALKRLSGVFGVILGWRIFGEKRILQKIFASLLMFGGSFLIVVS